MYCQYCQCTKCFSLLLVPVTKYRLFRQKRLDSVIRNVIGVSSRLKCTTLCSTTDGCHAVNIMSYYDNTCQLTTGLSNETEMIDNGNANLYVRGMNTSAIQCYNNTRMHSSRMRTTCTAIVWEGVYLTREGCICQGGVPGLGRCTWSKGGCTWGCTCQGGCTWQGEAVPARGQCIWS